MMFMKSIVWILYSLELARSSGKNCTHPLQTKCLLKWHDVQHISHCLFLSVVNSLLHEFFPVNCNTKFAVGNLLTVLITFLIHKNICKCLFSLHHSHDLTNVTWVTILAIHYILYIVLLMIASFMGTWVTNIPWPFL